MATAAPSAEIIVDEVNCQLEDAIYAANNGTTENGCTGSSGPDTIILDVAEVYVFDTLPTITSDITIDGKGNAIISGGYSGIFYVYYGDLTLNNVTISGGSASHGGAVRNESTLTVINSTFSNNSATSGGGAIYSAGKATVTDSTFFNNSSPQGGAIWNNDSNAYEMTVSNSTFYNNTAEDFGGAIFSYNSVVGSNLRVTNSTFSDNTTTATTYGADIAIYNGGGGANVTVINSTLSSDADTDSGFYSYVGSAVFENTIVATGCVKSPSATITSNGYNLETGTSCGFTDASDKQNTDLLLGPLQDNGGPTKTRALLDGSPARDQIPPASCSEPADQRGIARPYPQNGNCDIGAFEYISIQLTISYTPGDSTAQLTWNEVSESYQVWRSTEPYAGFVLFSDNNQNTSFTVDVDPAINYYYEVHGMQSGGLAATSNRVGVFSFALTPGSP